MVATRYKVDAGGLTYTVVDDLSLTFGAILTGRAVDEVTGSAPRSPVSLAVDLPFVVARGYGAGMFAVAGVPDRVVPDLATTSYSVGLTVTASGYRNAALIVNLPAGTPLPFAAPVVTLRPVPVRLQGRVVKESDRTSIAGSLVSSATDGLLLLRAPLGFAHAKGVTVNARALTPAGPARQLKFAASRGDSVITLDNAAGLATGGILRVGTGAASEIAVIGVAGPGADQVALSGSLVASHPAAAPIQGVTPGASTGSSTLSRDADAGEGVLVLAGPLAGASVELADGARREFRDLDALSDAEGFYHIDGVTGVRALDVRASASGFGDVTHTVAIAYDTAVNLVGFRMSP